MTTTFDAALHPRGAAGKFTETTHPEAPVSISGDHSPVDRASNAIAVAMDEDITVTEGSIADWGLTSDDFSPASEDTDLVSAMGEAAAMAIEAGEGLDEKELHASVMNAIAAQCDERVTVCTRVQEAWLYGTMGPDDFTPVAEEEDVLDYLAAAAIKGYRGEQE